MARLVTKPLAQPAVNKRIATKPLPAKNQLGFTLIELIVVIIILGIVAVVAAPRFFDVKTDARIAALRGMQGAINAALPLTRAKCELDAACNVRAAAANVLPEVTIFTSGCKCTARSYYFYQWLLI